MQLTDLNWPAIQALNKDTPVVFPVAALEQHGRHLVFEVRQRHRQRSDLLLLFATYWQLGGKPWEIEPRLQQHEMGHACEWETSMILRLAPKLVGALEKLDPVPFGSPFEPAS